MPSVFTVFGVIFTLSVYFQVLDRTWFSHLHPFIDVSEWLLISLKLFIIAVSLYRMSQWSLEQQPPEHNAGDDTPSENLTYQQQIASFRKRMQWKIVRVLKLLFQTQQNK